MKPLQQTFAGKIAKTKLLACSVSAVLLLSAFAQPTVRIDGTAVGPRPLEAQTRAAVIRDYLQAWQSLDASLQDNRADLLDASFVGIAREKFSDTVREQQDLGTKTRYRDIAHDIKIVFFSPEGLSIQLQDTVEYEVQIVDHDQPLAVQHVHSRYIAVLTPTEVRWKVRILQAQPE